ncbi:MAG: hypothetical protein RJA61_623 [Candidatus Parcubacteria bacterium]|jgi:hypothetical protein
MTTVSLARLQEIDRMVVDLLNEIPHEHKPTEAEFHKRVRTKDVYRNYVIELVNIRISRAITPLELLAYIQYKQKEELEITRRFEEEQIGLAKQHK